MVTVNLKKIVGFNEIRKIKLWSAIVYLHSAINSDWFKQSVLTHKYLGKYQYANNEGRSNEEIYNLLMSGNEILSPEIDNEIDVDIELYTKWFSSVIGYTYPNITTQFINRKYFDKMSKNEIASNILHEYLHKQGWSHDFNPTARRPYSIPYAIGNIVLLSESKSHYLDHK